MAVQYDEMSPHQKYESNYHIYILKKVGQTCTVSALCAFSRAKCELCIPEAFE